MPAANVNWPAPLTRFPTLWPGQMGVPGTDNNRGERMHSTGEVFYVDPNFPGVTDQRDGTSPTAPLATVTAALTKCTAYAGDVIAVMAGNTNEYHDVSQGRLLPISEEVIVTVPGVRIVGICPSGSVGVWWTPASDGGTCITIQANDVLVEGFMFDEGIYSGCNAIYAEYDGAATFGDYATVRHCQFNSNVDIGIQIEYSWFCNIHDNVFTGCQEYGVYCDREGSGTAYSMIHHNWFHNVGVGGGGIAGGAVFVPGADYCKIAYNQIYNSAAQSGAAATWEGICTGFPGILPDDPQVTGRQNIVHHNIMGCALPGGGAGDYDDFNEADNTPVGGQTDAWIQNYCLNGPSTTIPI